MDTLMAIKGKDYVLMVCDTSAAFSIIRLKDDEDKLLEVDDDKLMGASGENYDRVGFTSLMHRNFELYKYRNNTKLGIDQAAHYVRHTLSEGIRSRGAKMANVLLAGVDKDDSAAPKLYYFDYLGSSQEVDKAAHGYSGMICLGLMDRHWKPDMTLEEGIQLIKWCAEEMQRRFLVAQPRFMMKCVDATGVRTIPLELN